MEPWQVCSGDAVLILLCVRPKNLGSLWDEWARALAHIWLQPDACPSLLWKLLMSNLIQCRVNFQFLLWLNGGFPSLSHSITCSSLHISACGRSVRTVAALYWRLANFESIFTKIRFVFQTLLLRQKPAESSWRFQIPKQYFSFILFQAMPLLHSLSHFCKNTKMRREGKRY